MELTNDLSQLKDLVLRLVTRITELEAENAALKAENAELRLRLNQNSNNSHKPPSTAGYGKKPAIPQSKGQKTGGQFGHKGKTLQMVSQADKTIVHHALSCICCSRPFTASDVEQIIHKRQVFDIPAPKLEVTEHQIGVIKCCGHQHKGAYPESVSQPVQYGSKIKALSVLLNTDYKIPFEKIEQLLGDLYDCSFNESTAISTNVSCYESLQSIEQQIKEEVLQSPQVHFDETGMRVQGKLHWFHVACTGLFTYLFVHPKRGKQALQSDDSVLKDFHNWAIHDCWKTYFGFDQCQHALCNAHILRELESLIEQGSKWAVEMKELLLHLYKMSEKATQVLHNKDPWVEKYQAICQKADEEEPLPIVPKRGKPKKTKGRNLMERLVQYQDGVLAFAFMEAIPFTNNQAERDIRCLKTKQKVATSFRTFNGAQHYARIQSFVSTLRKHKMNVFHNLIHIFNKQQVVFTNA